MENSLWTKTAMKNVNNQLLKVTLRNHGRKNALQNAERYMLVTTIEEKKWVMKMQNKENAKVGT